MADDPVTPRIEGDQGDRLERGLVGKRAGVEVAPEGVLLGATRARRQRGQQAGNDEETLHGLLPQLD